MTVIVKGMVYRHQVASKHSQCDACDHPILRGNEYVRVMWNKKKVIERFHTTCFKEEFTDEKS